MALIAVAPVLVWAGSGSTDWFGGRGGSHTESAAPGSGGLVDTPDHRSVQAAAGDQASEAQRGAGVSGDTAAAGVPLAGATEATASQPAKESTDSGTTDAPPGQRPAANPTSTSEPTTARNATSTANPTTTVPPPTRARATTTQGPTTTAQDATTRRRVPGGGCGVATSLPTGGRQMSNGFSSAAGGERGFFLTIPADYDPSRAYPLVIAYSGTDWVGSQIRGYFELEDGRGTEVVVYPDPQWHDFPGWGRLGGWLLGPHGGPASGHEDINFTSELIDHLGENLCLDRTKVLAVGHSWGGDMAHVAACFVGDMITAAAPIAANEPFWFDPGPTTIGCKGEPAIWNFFGRNDTHFSHQAYPGEFGDLQNAFWSTRYGCDGATADLGGGGSGTTVRFEGCGDRLRYSFYDAGFGHQQPSYYSSSVLSWFREM